MAFLSTNEDVEAHFNSLVIKLEAGVLNAKLNQFMALMLLEFGVPPITVATYAISADPIKWIDFFRQRPSYLGLPDEVWGLMHTRFNEFKHNLYQ